jgi:hypothetical protein
MVYHVEPFEVADAADWPAELQTRLDELSAEGWTLVTLYTRDMPSPQVGGMTGLRPAVPYTVLILHQP